MSNNEENIEPNNLQHQEVSPNNEGNNNKQFVGGRVTGTIGWKAPESHELIKQAKILRMTGSKGGKDKSYKTLTKLVAKELKIEPRND